VSGIFSAFLLTFAGLFPIVNPIESAPFFFGMTASMTVAERNAMARKVAINGVGLLLGSMVLGPYLLELFGIRLPVVRIAGGFVVTALGWKLLTQEDWSDHPDSSDLPAARGRGKIGSFYPLTMPLTVGPGSMSVAITIGSRQGEGFSPLAEFASHATGALLGIIAIGLSIYLAFRFAASMAKLLGETGLEVLVRLSAFILMCIGIEIIWNGWTALNALH
jgi:multiple antibiotic resistance protein